MVIAFDSETDLFGPGYKAPRAACWTWQHLGLEPRIIHAADAEPTLREWLQSDDLLVGQNVAYDTAVMIANYPRLTPLVFAKYDADQITCTKLREQLCDIALGRFRGEVGADGEWHARGYDLSSLSHRYRGVRLEKDEWRLRYGEYLDTPLSEWPAGAREYPLLDATATLEVYLGQEQALTAIAPDVFADQFRQARAQFALYLTTCWGLRADADRVEAFARIAEARMHELQDELTAAGLVHVDGSADTKRAMGAMSEACAELGIEPILTKGGKVSLAAEACARVSPQ